MKAYISDNESLLELLLHHLKKLGCHLIRGKVPKETNSNRSSILVDVEGPVENDMPVSPLWLQSARGLQNSEGGDAHRPWRAHDGEEKPNCALSHKDELTSSRCGDLLMAFRHTVSRPPARQT